MRQEFRSKTALVASDLRNSWLSVNDGVLARSAESEKTIASELQRGPSIIKTVSVSVEVGSLEPASVVDGLGGSESSGSGLERRPSKIQRILSLSRQSQ